MDINETKIRTGDDWNTLFKSIYTQHYSNLCSYARMFVTNSEEAEEIVQNCIFKLWEQHKSFDTIDNLSSYLFRVVKNRCLNEIAHKKIEGRYLSEAWVELKALELESLQIDDYQEKRELQLKKAIEELPERSKEILTLSKFEGLKNKEIAQKLDISIKAVEAGITRAFSLLRKSLNKD